MSPGRKPSSTTPGDGNFSMPWYKAFPGTDMGSASFYTLNAKERGLLLSLRHVYWLDGRVPRDIKAMSRCVRLDTDDVSEALTEAVLAHFEPDTSDPSYMVCIDLHRQRLALGAVREKQSKGGRIGAEKANAHRGGRPAGQPEGQPEGHPAGQPAGQPERDPQVDPRVASSTSTSTSTSLSPRAGDGNPSSATESDPWIDEYARAEAAAVVRGNGAGRPA